MNKKYTVFVSSTYEDLKEERQEVMQALLEMDCIPCGMELFPAADEEQFEFIKSIINDCDYYILILAGKYGSTNAKGISYTELEFQYALDQKIPIISFIHSDINSLPHSKCEQSQEKVEKLSKFTSLAKEKLCRFWSNKEELSGSVSRSMIQLIKRHPAVGWVRANIVSNEETLTKITQLYEENRELKTNLDNSTSKNYVLSGNQHINVVFYDYDHEPDTFTKKMTLNDILKIIGLILIEERPRQVIEDKICSIVGLEYFKEMNYEIPYIMPIKISNESMGEILLKLLSLNYISINHQSHNNDYELSTISTYSLTELGRNVFLQLSENLL